MSYYLETYTFWSTHLVATHIVFLSCTYIVPVSHYFITVAQFLFTFSILVVYITFWAHITLARIRFSSRASTFWARNTLVRIKCTVCKFSSSCCAMFGSSHCHHRSGIVISSPVITNPDTLPFAVIIKFR